MKTISVRLDKNMHKKLKLVAQREYRSVIGQVQYILSQYIKSAELPNPNSTPTFLPADKDISQKPKRKY
jgi:hypothetical protein